MLNISISLGTIQKLIDRASAAILPHYGAIADKARSSRHNHLDETTWGKRRQTLLALGHGQQLTAFFMIHANRSKEAFEQLIGYWNGNCLDQDF